MKRPATSAAVPKYGSKKPKVTARAQKLSKQQLQHMADVIEFVGSQSSVQDNDALSVKSVESSVMDRAESRDVLKGVDALTACSNLHAEIAKLTNVIQLQQVQISGLEKQLTAVLSMLHGISSQQQSQLQNQLNFNQQLNTQKPSVSKSSTEAAAVGGSTDGRSFGGAVSQGRSHDRRDRQDRNHSNRAVWGQRTDSTTEDAADNSDSQFTLIVHRTLNDASRRRRNIIVTGLPEESETNVSDRTTFEEFLAAFLPSKPAIAAGRNCIRLGKASFFHPRRLLVRLESEDAAAALLKDASSLRHVDDEYIANNVFINADLSPTAAKLAYESRKKRREFRMRRAAAGTTSGSDVVNDAPPGQSQQSYSSQESMDDLPALSSPGRVAPSTGVAATTDDNKLVESVSTQLAGATSGVVIANSAAPAAAASSDVTGGGAEGNGEPVQLPSQSSFH